MNKVDAFLLGFAVASLIWTLAYGVICSSYRRTCETYSELCRKLTEDRLRDHFGGDLPDGWQWNSER